MVNGRLTAGFPRSGITNGGNTPAVACAQRLGAEPSRARFFSLGFIRKPRGIMARE